MINIIIFSRCDLIRFALMQTVNDILQSVCGGRGTDITVCRSLGDFQERMRRGRSPVGIFDVDGVSVPHQMAVFHGVHCPQQSLLIFCKEARDTVVFDAYRHVSAQTLSKCDSIVRLKAALQRLIFAGGVTEAAPRWMAEVSAPVVLTRREAEVLPYIVLNVANKDIGICLGIGPKTVYGRRQHIYAKYGVDGPRLLREKLAGN